MSPHHQIYALIKEMDAQRIELQRLAEEPAETIKKRFHQDVTGPLSSLAARAYNMEAINKGLFK